MTELFLLWLGALADTYTTLRFVKHPNLREGNPLGVKTTLAVKFAITGFLTWLNLYAAPGSFGAEFSAYFCGVVWLIVAIRNYKTWRKVRGK